MAFRWMGVVVAVGTIVALAGACVPTSAAGGAGLSSGEDGESTPSDTVQEGASVPATLAKRTTSSTLAIKLTFASKADYDNTKFLGILFVKGADSAATCGKVWSKSLDLTDPARLNVVPYPRNGSTILYEPGEGNVSIFIYTFTALPSGFCLDNADCSANQEAASSDASVSDADAGGDASSSGLCRAAGAGLGTCDPVGATDPTSGGCAVVTIADKGSATTEVTLTPPSP